MERSTCLDCGAKLDDEWIANLCGKCIREKGNNRLQMTNHAPSATVDEPKHLSTEQRQAIFNFFHDKEVVLMDDDLNTIEGIVYPRTYPYTLKDEQNTVDETINKGELDELLMHISGIFDGWHSDGTAWTEYDESVRKRISEFRIKYKTFDSEGNDGKV